MKKIIFVHSFNDRSGSPKVLSQVVRAVKRHNVEVEVLTSGHGNGFLSELPCIRREIFYRRSESKLLTLIYYIASQFTLFLYCLRYWRQDVSFYVNTMMPFGAAMAALLTGKAVIYHVHETSLRPKLLKIFLRFIIAWSASKIIFVSEYLCRKEGFKDKRQYVVHNALDGHIKTRPCRELRETFNVLMLCSLKKYKGVFEFLEVAKNLIGNDYISFTLVLNADQEEVNFWGNETAIPSNVNLYSRQADVSSFYENADLLLNLSRPDEWVETFGLTILEGMSYGLPVVVPPVGGPTEIVRDGHEGFLISCYDTCRILEVIVQLSVDPEYHLSLARNAEARAQDFSLAKFERKIIGIVDV